jgi:hypothetical protein
MAVLCVGSRLIGDSRLIGKRFINRFARHFLISELFIIACHFFWPKIDP